MNAQVASGEADREKLKKGSIFIHYASVWEGVHLYTHPPRLNCDAHRLKTHNGTITPASRD